MNDKPLLPIKLFVALDRDYHPNPIPKSTGFDPLVKVTSELRRTLVNQVGNVRSYFSAPFKKWTGVPAVAKVTLREKACSKSKRPFRVFNTKTCPIIGGAGLGQFHISITPESLDALEKKIGYGDKDPEISHISTIESIEPYSIDDAMGGKTFQELSKVVDEGLPLRIRLFQHFRHAQNISIQKELNSLDLLNVKPLHYTDGLSVLEVKVRDVNGIALLASFPGTHTISGFPEFGIARTASRVMQSLPSHLLPSPREDIKYPLVGIIDSGTDPLNKSLQKWIQDRWDVVPRELQDNDHGSFVAGMICGGRILNHNDVRFPSAVSKIVDVVAFGNEGTVNEQDLIRITREAVIKYPMVDVWNLSFAITDHFCKDEEFSLFGCVLAELAHKYGKTFVVSAGNRLDTPSPGWPRETLSNDQDRICAPADSPTCLVVGSLAHSDNASTCVKSEEPSSFSRRGPGSAYLMAPHLMHYGGNCKEDLTYTQTGVVSIDGNGNLAEDIGTSFATPIISTLVANITDSVSHEDDPATLGRAMLVHNAFLRNSVIDPSQFNHLGAGRPGDLDEILHCFHDSATVVLRADLGRDPIVVKKHFPIPPCLIKDGSVGGEFLMTLAYSPPMDPEAGFELCQTNVDALLGTVDPISNNFKTQIHPYPKMKEEGWEDQLIKHGFKWSPLKLYRRSFSASRKNKLGGMSWELRLKLLRRAALKIVNGEHQVYLLITIRDNDPDRDNPLNIYDEFIQEIENLGWEITNLRISDQQRVR